VTNLRTESRTTRKQVTGVWLLPAVAFLFGGVWAENHTMEGWAAFVVLAVGLIAGALWQLLHRRDLTDRFTPFAVFVLFGAGFLAIAPSGYLLANSGPGHALAGVIAGAVLTERWLRTRTSLP
jgi:glucose uptake protein GlcU